MSNRTYFEDKRFLSQQRIKDTFFDYLLGRILDIAARVWGSERGVFGSLTLVSGGNDKFSVQTLPKDLLDGDGNIITLDGADGTGIQFENTAAATYYVAARHNLVPSGVLRNQRNNVIFYDTEEDRIGEVAEPTSVAEIGGTLEIVVDSIFETGVSHAGRFVTVWLRRPLTTQESVAIEVNLTVAWVGGVNKVTTTGLLGQAGGGASTDTTDYQVFAQGVTVRKTDLSLVDPYAYIGSVTGAGAGNPPAGFSTAGQIDVSDGINPDLQEAYTAGREISPSGTYGGAVKISSADSGDPLNSILHLDRRSSTEGAPVNLANLMDSGGMGQLNLVPVSHATASLQETEPGTSAAHIAGIGVMDLTRGGVNVGAAGVRREADLVLLTGFATAAMNQLYVLGATPGATQVYLTPLDGSSVAAYWNPAESGNVEFLRMRVAVASTPEGSGSEPRIGQGLSVHGTNEEGVPAGAPIKAWPWSADDLAQFHDRTTSPAPRIQSRVTRDGILQTETTGDSGDLANTIFRLRRFGCTDWMQHMLYMEIGDVSAIPIAILQTLRPTGGTLLEGNGVTLSGNAITFTGGGVNLLNSTLRLTEKLHLIWLEDCADDADNGLYVIDDGTIVTAELDVLNLDGSTPSFAGASGYARVLVPKYVVGNILPHAETDPEGILQWWTGFTHVMRDGQGNATRWRLIPDGAYGNLVEYFDAEHPPGYWARFNLGAPGTTEGVFDFNRRMEIREDGDDENALFVEGGGGTGIFTDVQPVTLGVQSSLVGTNEYQCGLHDGVLIRPPAFRDDFMYENWGSKANAPKFYSAGADGTGDVWVTWGDSGVKLTTSTTTSNMAWLMGPRRLHADTAKNWRWVFSAIVALGQFDNTASMIQIGLRNNLFPSGQFEFYFQRMAAVSGGNWEFKGWDGGAGFAYNTGVSCVAGNWYWLNIIILGSTLVLYYVGRLGYNTLPNAMTGVATRNMNNSMDGENSFYFPELRVRTDEGFSKDLNCCFWEWHNRKKPIRGVASIIPDFV